MPYDMRHWKNHRLWIRVQCIGLACLCCVLCACQRTNEAVKTEDFAMAAQVTISLYTSPQQAEELSGKIGDTIHDLETALSWRIEDSETAQINRCAGDGTLVSAPAVAQLLEQVLPVTAASGGKFQPVIGPLTRLWDIGGEHPRVPEQQEIDAVLPLVTEQGLVVQGDMVSLPDQGQSIDLGAVGKGAACDYAQQLLEDTDIPAVLAVGGSVFTYGTKPDGSAWRIAVRDPGQSTATAGVLNLEGTNHISTSGGYERFFEQDGVRYHHLLDPDTGRPGGGSWSSVTVICYSGALADALSTAVFLMEKEEGLALLRSFDAQGVLIDEENGITLTQGLEDCFSPSAGFTVAV